MVSLFYDPGEVRTHDLHPVKAIFLTDERKGVDKTYMY